MRITITGLATGSITCQAITDDGDLLDGEALGGRHCIMAVGLMETAKLAMMHGRWGVLDEKNQLTVTYPNPLMPTNPPKGKTRKVPR